MTSGTFLILPSIISPAGVRLFISKARCFPNPAFGRSHSQSFYNTVRINNPHLTYNTSQLRICLSHGLHSHDISASPTPKWNLVCQLEVSASPVPTRNLIPSWSAIKLKINTRRKGLSTILDCRCGAWDESHWKRDMMYIVNDNEHSESNPSTISVE